MGPDFLWVAVFTMGGAALGLVTSMVGLRKGRDLWYWLGLYAFMMVAVLVLGVEHPFWTILGGSLAAGLAAGVIQSLLMDKYRQKNPWFEPEMRKSRRRVALGFIVFAMTVGLLFGVVLGAIAWGLSGVV